MHRFAHEDISMSSKKQIADIIKTVREGLKTMDADHQSQVKHYIDALKSIRELVEQIFADSDFQSVDSYPMMKNIYYGELLELTKVPDDPEPEFKPINPNLPMSAQRKRLSAMTSYPKNHISRKQLEEAKIYAVLRNSTKQQNAADKLSQQQPAHKPAHKPRKPSGKPVLQPKTSFNKPNIKPNINASVKAGGFAIGRKISRDKGGKMGRKTRSKPKQISPLVGKPDDKYVFKIGDQKCLMVNSILYQVSEDGQSADHLGDCGDYRPSGVQFTRITNQDFEEWYQDQDGNIYDEDKQMIGVNSDRGLIVSDKA